MAKLVALDFEQPANLYDAIRTALESRTAFCVLDQRLNKELQERQLSLLGATHIRSEAGESQLSRGHEVGADVGVVMLTSGSSGVPKAAELSWAALEASAAMTSSALKINQPSCWVPALPASHIGGLAVLLRAGFGFAKLLFTSDIERAPAEGATHVALVQAQASQLDLSGYQYVLLGGAKPPQVIAPNVVATWGMTETGSGVVYDGYCLPGVEMCAVDGELLVRTPTLFSRYRTEEIDWATGTDGRSDWFATGDGGEVVEGRVRVFGRLGSVINTGGEKVWPEQVESLIVAKTGLRDVAITSVPDERWGEAIVMVAVGADENSIALVRDICEEGIGPWAKPKHVVLTESLPRTSNGKLQRAALSELASKQIL